MATLSRTTDLVYPEYYSSKFDTDAGWDKSTQTESEDKLELPGQEEKAGQGTPLACLYEGLLSKRQFKEVEFLVNNFFPPPAS